MSLSTLAARVRRLLSMGPKDLLGRSSADPRSAPAGSAQRQRAMYVRIARFENADAHWDERIAEVRRRIQSRGEGTPMEQAGLAVRRTMMLVDRESGRGASVIFCDTEEDVRLVDEAMSRMSPPPGGGTLASAEVYEVAVDEQRS